MGTSATSIRPALCWERALIFLTIGTQLPFDRLVQIVDSYPNNNNEQIFAQIGIGKYRPRNFDYSQAVSPQEYKEKVLSARVIISHAGIGTVLSAKKFGKPIILFPRRAALGEHRNDHQLATCKQLEDRRGVYVTYDEAQLYDVMAHGDLLPADDTATSLSNLTSTLNKYFGQR